MEDKRLKELMGQVGMPNSRSLMLVLLQVENETEQRCQPRADAVKALVEKWFQEGERPELPDAARNAYAKCSRELRIALEDK